MRSGLARIAGGLGEWAGIPMPLEGSPLVIEPTYHKAAELMAIGREAAPPAEPSDARIRNHFWSWTRRTEIVVWEEGGKILWGPSTRPHHIDIDLGTLGAADAWGIEQESRAVHLLGTLVKHRQFKQYMLTGMFMVRSERSGISYLFRRLKPTLALSTIGDVRILAALCLHPIAYYERSWAGAMCPTDDVIAHLSLMRGDECMFWRRANQHPPWRPEAGIG